MRRSELVALTLTDIEHQPGGVLLTIRRSKADQYADGQTVAVVIGQHAATDPIAALDAWLVVRGTDPGRVFTAMPNRVVTLDPGVHLQPRPRPLTRLAKAASGDAPQRPPG